MGRTTGFYQNFGLDCHRLGKALNCVRANPCGTYEEIASCMLENRPVAEGYLGWLRHTGLVCLCGTPRPLQRVEYALTPYAQQAISHDTGFTDQGSQWLMHYYLSSEHAERSEAWYVLFNEYLHPGMHFTLEQFRGYFASTAGARSSNRGAVQKDPQTALSCYTQPKALARLGIILRDQDGYTAANDAEIPMLIVGYMLLDWWQRRYPRTGTLRLAQLCQEAGSVGRLCLADEARVRRWVQALTGLGYLTSSDTQHQPVNRVFAGDPIDLLQRYYEQR